jgi:2',3'-cyclic-nucleotide 2'-phosphodiesterase (5'-nucleotidase family)
MKKLFLFLFPLNIFASSLTILFTHDLHSHLEEYSLPDNQIVGGYARLYTAIQQKRLGNEANTLLVDAGDFSMGTCIQSIRATDSAELVTMGAMGYDVITLGNHEFELGQNSLADALIAAKKQKEEPLPPIVASNTIINPGFPGLTKLYKAFEDYPILPYKVIQKANMKIGIFGLLGIHAISCAPQAHPVIFENYLQVAKDIVSILIHKEKVDFIICLSHSGTWDDKTISEDEILAKKIPQIDVIISGHTHTLLNPYIRINNTLIVSCGAYGQYLGYLKVEKENKKITVNNYDLIPITPKIKKNPHIDKLVEKFVKKTDEEYLTLFGYHYNQSIAFSPFFLQCYLWETGNREFAMPSGLGNLITDAFVHAVKCTEGKNYIPIDLVIEPCAFLRTSLNAGTISINDIFNVLCFGIGLDGFCGYPLVTFWLTGKEIKNILEVDTSLSNTMDDARLQIAGMQVFYDPKSPPYERIKKVKINDKAIEDSKLYRICANWIFLAMYDYSQSVLQNKIHFVPKDKDGNIIKDFSTTRLIYNEKKNIELKEWVALAMYLKTFTTKPENKLPVIPEKYKKPQINFFISN